MVYSQAWYEKNFLLRFEISLYAEVTLMTFGFSQTPINTLTFFSVISSPVYLVVTTKNQVKVYLFLEILFQNIQMELFRRGFRGTNTWIW